MSNRGFLSNDYLEPFFKQWLNTFTLREIGNIVFLPKTDRNYRLLEFSDWLIEKSLSFGFFNVRSFDFDSLISVEAIFKNKDFWIINNAEDLINEGNYLFLNLIIDYFRTKKKGLLLIWESNNYLYENVDLNLVEYTIFEQAYYYPLYQKEQIYQFCDYLNKKWKVSFSKEYQQKLYQYFGGYLWPIKAIYRHLIITASFHESEDSFNSFDVVRKVEIILNDIYQEKNQADINQQRYLQLMNFCDQDDNMPRFFDLFFKKKLAELKFDNANIYIGQKNISNELSINLKKVFLFFLNNQNKIIKKEQFANIYWGKRWENQYSEWAMAQAIRRIRKKIEQYRLSVKIKTIKNRGYLCQSENMSL